MSVSGERIDLTHKFTAPDWDFRSAVLGEETVRRLLTTDPTLWLSGSALARSDETKGVSLDMRGFSDTFTKLKTSCVSSTVMMAATPSATPEQVPLANKSLAVPTLPGAWMTPQNPFGWPTPAPAMSQPAASTADPPVGTETSPSARGVFIVPTAPAPPAPAPAKSGPARGSSTFPHGTDVSTASENHPDPAPSAGPGIAQSASAQACEGKIPSEPQHVTGRVTAFLSDQEAQERTQRVEIILGIKVGAAYASLPRVNVLRSDDRGSTMAAIPENLTVKLGDLVELNSRHRDQGVPCSFVPWTINRLIDRAQ